MYSFALLVGLINRSAAWFIVVCWGRFFLKLFGVEVVVDYENQKELLDLKRRIVFIDRRSTLIQNLNVFENIALANSYHENRSPKDIKVQIDPIVEMFELKGLLDLKPTDLAPGDKRVVKFILYFQCIEGKCPALQTDPRPSRQPAPPPEPG